MHRLGNCNSHPREWGNTTAYYNRLTVSNKSQLRRDVEDFPPLPGYGLSTPPPSPHHLLRTDCLDLGHTKSYFDLCAKLRGDFKQIEYGDVFVVRVRNTTATLWQHQVTGPQLLCRLPAPFCDQFATVQEWDLDLRDRSQSLRLDFLSRICMPATTPFESAAFYQKMKASTLGGAGLVTREVQKFHIVDRLFSPTESRLILNELGFYHRSPADPIQQAFQQFGQSSDAQRPSVVVRELIDDMDSIPIANITPEALTSLHDLRHQRHLRQLQGPSMQVGHQMETSIPSPNDGVRTTTYREAPEAISSSVDAKRPRLCSSPRNF